MVKPKRKAERQAEICKLLLRNVSLPPPRKKKPQNYILSTHSLIQRLNEVPHVDLF